MDSPDNVDHRDGHERHPDALPDPCTVCGAIADERYNGEAYCQQHYAERIRRAATW